MEQSFKNLTSSQKAIIALKVEERLAEEARTRQLTGLRNQLANDNGLSSANSFIKERATKEAGEIVGVNNAYISIAKRIKKLAPELLIFILDGLITIPQAKKLASLAAHQRAEPRAGEMLREGKENGDRAKPGQHVGNQHTVEKSHGVTVPPTLSEIGVSKMQSSRWQ